MTITKQPSTCVGEPTCSASGEGYTQSFPRFRSVFPPKAAAPVTPALSRELLLSDLHALPEDRCLVENDEFTVYAAQATEIPHLLQEVGRLREVTFREAGEGTGKQCDLDEFDRHYWHLLLWNQSKDELAGAYRAGNTAGILAEHGVDGLYTNTLFRYSERFFAKMGPALELGRSFVRSEYQRQYAPLLLLWKAIARFVALRPEMPVLFGAVSVSNSYNRASRELIYSFFEERKQGDELAGLVTPRRPYRPIRMGRWDCRAVCHILRDLNELSEPIADVETDGKGLPILLKQYAKVGGKLVGFNVDRKFSDVLDGLVVVDLRQTEPALLDRYMGREAAGEFPPFSRTGLAIGFRLSQGSFGRNNAGIRGGGQRFVESQPGCRKLFRSQTFLNPFKKLAFLFSDVARESVPELTQSCLVEAASGRLCEVVSQQGMFGDQFFHQSSELRISPGDGEQVRLFGGEVILNFLFEMLLDFRLPRLQFGRTGE